MFEQWRGLGATKAPPRSAHASYRPNLEALESRVVPAAIRALPGFTTNTLPANDDGSTAAVNIGFSVNFFGLTNSQLFVNNNGNVTFGQDFFDYTPGDLNSNNGGVPIIAAFFSDVDTTGTGSGVVTYGTDTLCGVNVFGVNYVNVGYFNSKVDKLNSFQIILIDRSDTGTGNFDIEFNYDKVQWETGDFDGGVNGLGPPGGTSAAVGYTNGSGNAGTFFELPGSRMPGSFIDSGPSALINTSLAANTPGRIHFMVRNGQVVQQFDSSGDVTDQTRTFFPLRYITTPDTATQRGNLTVVNITDTLSTVGDLDACLDLVSSNNGGVTFDGPITVVFTKTLAGNARIVNATGYTPAGLPYITIDVSGLPPGRPVLRVPLVLSNPDLDAPSTFEMLNGGNYRIFAGTFDPSQVT